jgi:hypothetical protein
VVVSIAAAVIAARDGTSADAGPNNARPAAVRAGNGAGSEAATTAGCNGHATTSQAATTAGCNGHAATSKAATTAGRD